ncbi:MAG TPA: ergosterol biosynthesis protein, partial [Nannocystis sp.]
MPACFALLALYTLVFVLHLIVPGRWVTGYVHHEHTGVRLRYRLNGLRVMAIMVALYFLASATGMIAWDYLYLHRWENLATACVVGLAFTAAIVLPAPPRGSLLADLYLGRRENPQLLGGHVDAKMFLYLIGAVMLELNLLSFAAHHVMLYPTDPSPGVFLHVGLFSFFLCEYLYFEEVHLYTYDFLAERLGFKLGWGCLTFYGFFYAVGLWSLADAPNPHTPTALLVACALLFFTGWALARGANMQKYFFKRDPARAAFGLIVPEAIEQDGRRLLVNGFWGLS